MRDLSHLEQYRQPHPRSDWRGDAFNGCFNVPVGTQRFLIIASNGGGWDHVSISHKHRPPTWTEMCQIKDLFFNPEEIAVQFHPPQSQYINIHPNCLHLWRWQQGDFPRPNLWLV